jgi:short-subunit dehydrogenase
MDINEYLKPYEAQYNIYKGSDGDNYVQVVTELTDSDNFDYYYEQLRKFSCLRMYREKGYDIDVFYDVTKSEDWDRVFAEAGCPDILINNAGAGGKIAPVAEQTDAEIISTININLTGTILGCRRAAELMCARKSGMIINISSVCALYAWPGWSVYTAAKAGLAKFSHGLYTELRPYGVRVSCVTPSWGQTNFNHAACISGASENPELAKKCTAPEELGMIIRQLVEQPDHLAVPDITIQPMIQDISPM